MAVTVAQLAGAIRAGDGVTTPDEPLLSILTRLSNVADAVIERHAKGAPDAIKDEAKVRLVAYLYDSPNAAPSDRYAAAWRNSGAAALVGPWTVRRVEGE